MTENQTTERRLYLVLAIIATIILVGSLAAPRVWPQPAVGAFQR